MMSARQRYLKATAWEFRHRTFLIVGLGAITGAISLCLPDPFTGRRLWIEFPWMCAAAFGIGLSGFAIRAWATGHLPLVIITGRTIQTAKLVDSGPYAITRNPLYLGSWLAVCSAGLVLNMWGTVILTAAMAFKVRRLIVLEEQSLESALGESYREYAARVPRLIPRFTSVIRSLIRADSDWLYGIRGNFSFLGLLVGYAAAILWPSYWVIVGCTLLGRIVHLLLLRAERKRRHQQVRCDYPEI